MTPSSHTWVLLRGLTREQGHWGDFPARLAAALPPGSAVLTPDIAGNGARCGEASPATVPDLLDDVRSPTAHREAETAKAHRG